jgi:hypothetical protein
MTNRFNCWKIFYWLLLAFSLLLPTRVHAEGATFSAGLGFEFASGKYGTDTRTESVYLPFTVSVYPTKRIGFSLEIPYAYQSSSAVNTGVFLGAGGQMMRAQKQTVASTGSAMEAGSMSSATAANSDQSQGGLGDLTARGGYVLVPEGDLMPRIRPNVFVKFPTADRDKALGTGAFDEGVAVEFSKWLGGWYSFAEAGYTFQGKSPRLALKNYLSYNAGAGYLLGEKFLPMLIIKGSGAPVEGSTGLLEMRLKLKYQATAYIGIDGYFAKGITTSSPEYGSGLAIFHDF